MRSWSMRIFLLDEDGHERPADVFTKVVYNLHPTFENPVQSTRCRCSALSMQSEYLLTLAPRSLHQAALYLQ